MKLNRWPLGPVTFDSNDPRRASGGRRNVFLLNLAVAMITLNSSLMMGNLEAVKRNVQACHVTSVLRYLSLLSVFAWQLVDSVNLCIRVARVSSRAIERGRLGKGT